MNVAIGKRRTPELDTIASPAAASRRGEPTAVEDYLERILKARVYDAAVQTPLDRAPKLSRQLGVDVLLKREDLQPVFSFKVRGAFNKVASLSPEAFERGVVCASAGNHAQGVALATSRRGGVATIVMPTSTPAIKVDAVRAFGGNAVLHGENFDEAYVHALELVRERGAELVHPFDDPLVIAGQGTIGLEIVRQHPDPIEAIFVPVGGGGLISGVALLVKSLYPQTRIIGVEPVDAAAMHASLSAGELVTLPTVGAFADGVAVRRVGEETFRICQRLVDEMVTVSNDEICAAIRDVFEETRTLVEPAGALGVAGMKKWLTEHHGGNRFDGPMVCITSGANVNFSMLSHVAERTDLGAGREAILAVEIPERPGAFKTFCEAIGRRHITEFNYRYSDAQTAQIFVGVELSGGADERRELIATLEGLGYRTLDLSDNEMAKLHIRHMVGGHGRGVTDERLYRFRFPERRGALLNFLTAIGSDWNISLFHYRNHGSDYGRVLVGIQVPDAELADLESHLDQLGFFYADESDNPAFGMFLANH